MRERISSTTGFWSPQIYDNDNNPTTIVTDKDSGRTVVVGEAFQKNQHELIEICKEVKKRLTGKPNAELTTKERNYIYQLAQHAEIDALLYIKRVADKKELKLEGKITLLSTRAPCSYCHTFLQYILANMGVTLDYIWMDQTGYHLFPYTATNTWTEDQLSWPVWRQGLHHI